MGTILIVEDNLIICCLVEKTLLSAGYSSVIRAESVEEALVAIKEHNPKLVLIDINLGKEKDGVDLGKHLLREDKIPYVYISSNPDEHTLTRVNETRPYGFLLKPFSPEELKVMVSVLLHNNRFKKIDVTRHQKPEIDDVPFFLKEALKYIDDNVNEKIKISDLAALTKWNTQYFSKVFAKYLGVGPKEYIIEKKLQRAKYMLANTSVPIYDISFDLGFNSHSSFCRIFKKNTQKTPEGFRKLMIVNQLLTD